MLTKQGLRGNLGDWHFPTLNQTGIPKWRMNEGRKEQMNERVHLFQAVIRPILQCSKLLCLSQVREQPQPTLTHLCNGSWPRSISSCHQLSTDAPCRDLSIASFCHLLSSVFSFGERLPLVSYPPPPVMLLWAGNVWTTLMASRQAGQEREGKLQLFWIQCDVLNLCYSRSREPQTE